MIASIHKIPTDDSVESIDSFYIDFPRKLCYNTEKTFSIQQKIDNESLQSLLGELFDS